MAAPGSRARSALSAALLCRLAHTVTMVHRQSAVVPQLGVFSFCSALSFSFLSFTSFPSPAQAPPGAAGAPGPQGIGGPIGPPGAQGKGYIGGCPPVAPSTVLCKGKNSREHCWLRPEQQLQHSVASAAGHRPYRCRSVQAKRYQTSDCCPRRGSTDGECKWRLLHNYFLQ